MMTTAYRESALAQKIAEARRELDAIPRPSTLQRMLLSPATRHELDAIEATIANARDLATLETAGPRLESVLARASGEAAHARARERTIPEPAAPRRYSFWQRPTTVSFHERRPDLLRGAREHGAGLLAELEHDGVPLVLVTHAFRPEAFPAMLCHVACLLRAAAPHVPSFTVEPRGILRGSDSIAIAAGFDDAYVVRGHADLARAVLDAPLRAHLLAMRGWVRKLYVGEGLVDLAWEQAFPETDGPFPTPTELSLVTSIARRLWA